jgi:hypothetical protein
MVSLRVCVQLALLRKTTEIRELAILRNLGKGSAVGLKVEVSIYATVLGSCQSLLMLTSTALSATFVC